MKTPAMYATALLDRLGVTDAPNIRHIASQLEVDVEEHDVHGFDGALVRVKGAAQGIVALRASIRESGRKNFTIAHELGHLLLPGHDESAICRPENIEEWAPGLPQAELQANEFAGELLVPSFLAGPMVRGAKPSFRIVEKIATTFQTSLTASAYRYTQLTTHACAVVWSAGGYVRWFKRSQEFREWVRVRETTDRRTVANDAFLGLSLPTGPVSVAADSWLDGTFRDHAMVLEESRPMPHYGGVLSLLWVNESIQVADDDGEPEPPDPLEFTLHRKRWPSKRGRR